MLKILIEKELKAILLSPKFIATFGICSVLILLSVMLGIREFNTASKQYTAALNLVDQELRETTNLMMLSTKTYRKPDPMQIFVAGIQNDIGRFSSINTFTPVKLQSSTYSENPLFAVFRFIDFTFIVVIVLSLFAILFTYDAINGEREGGTLKLIFANPIPRTSYILAKFIGSWLGLIIPLLVPILLGLLLIVLFAVPITAGQWQNLLLFLLFSVLYFTFFIGLSLSISAMTRRSSSSFMALLVLWVSLVLIIPRSGVLIATQLISAPTFAEVEARIDGFSKEQWQGYWEIREKKIRERSKQIQSLSKEEREAFEDDNSWGWMEENEKEKNAMEAAIADYSSKLNEERRNKKMAQERLGFSISRISPASAFQLASMHLAGTHLSLKSYYEDQMKNYRNDFIAYKEQKQRESGEGHGGIQIRASSSGEFVVKAGRNAGAVDLSGMPEFAPPMHSLSAGFAAVAVDFGLLTFFSAVVFTIAFVAFQRYDVR